MQRDFIIKDLGPILHSYQYDKLKLMIFDDLRPLMSYWVKKVGRLTILSSVHFSDILPFAKCDMLIDW